MKRPADPIPFVYRAFVYRALAYRAVVLQAVVLQAVVLRFAAVVATTLLTACGPGSTLEGSISESFSLRFDRVEVRKQANSLLIEYLRDLMGGSDKVCKVVVDTEGLKLGNNSKIDSNIFLEHVGITRVATTGGDFPPLKNGQITLEDFEFRAGGSVSGDFDAVFENGRTIHGEFAETVQEVSFE